MTTLNRFLILLILELLLLLAQQSGILSLYGVRANLILAFFVVLILTERNPALLALLFAMLVAFVSLSGTFWLPEFLTLGAVLLAAFFGSRVLTGRLFLDLALLTVFATVFFSLGLPAMRQVAASGLNFSGFAFPSAAGLFLELAMNLAAGGVFVFLGSRDLVRKLFS